MGYAASMNIFGLIFPPQTPLGFVRRVQHKEDISSFHFRASRPFRHVAGQHGIFSIPNVRGFKAFSLASAPDDPEIMIATRMRPDSVFEMALTRLTPGDPVTLRGPVRDFTLGDSDGEVVFLAQGIGIAPFRSMLRHVSLRKLPVSSTLVHIDSSVPLFRAEMEKLATTAHYPDKIGFPARAAEIVSRLPGAFYYVAGGRSFIDSTVEALKRGGISSSRIRRDRFLRDE